MSYPAGWALVSVTGTYVARDGSPSAGSIEFSSPQLVLRSGTVVPAADISFPLDVNGSFTGQIPATDDPDAAPVGWLYTVTEHVPNGRTGLMISAPHTSPGIDMSTVVPVNFPAPPASPYPFVTTQQLASESSPTGASLVGFLQAGAGAVGRTVQAKFQDTVSVLDFGAKGDGVTNDLPALQAAINWAAAQANGSQVGTGYALHIPAGTYLCPGTLILPSNVFLRGDGWQCTTLRLAPNSNVDLLQTTGSGVGSNAAFPMNTPQSVNFGIFDICLDGNGANNTSGNCLTYYGFAFHIENVWLLNPAMHGIRSGGEPHGYTNPYTTNTVGVEAFLHHIIITEAGGHGVWYSGPNDAELDNVVVAGASAKSNMAYDAFHMDGNADCRMIGCHGYNGTLGGIAYALNDQAGQLQIIGGDYEGGHIANALFAGSFGISQVIGTRFYGNASSISVILAKTTMIKGYFFAPYGTQTSSVAIQVGTSTTSVGYSIIDAYVVGQTGPAVNVVHSLGGNHIVVRGFAGPGGSTLSGSPVPNDFVNVRMSGASPNVYFKGDLVPTILSGSVTTGVGGSATVVFSTPFSAPPKVSCGVVQGDTASMYGCVVSNITTSGFTLDVTKVSGSPLTLTNPSSVIVHWDATLNN